MGAFFDTNYEWRNLKYFFYPFYKVRFLHSNKDMILHLI